MKSTRLILLLYVLPCASLICYGGWRDMIPKKIPEIPQLPKLPFGEESSGTQTTDAPQFQYEPVQDDYSNRSPIDDLAAEDIRKARTIGRYSGGAVGGIVGYYVGKNNSNSDFERALYTGAGAVIGGLAGDQIGKWVGNVAANRRKQYATEYAYLESEVEASNRAIAVRKSDIDQTEAEVAAIQSRIQELTAKKHLQQEELIEARELKIQLDAEIEANSIKLVQYEEKLAYLEATLKESESEKDASEEERELWVQKHSQLTAKKGELSQQFAQLQQQGRDLRDTNNALVALLD